MGVIHRPGEEMILVNNLVPLARAANTYKGNGIDVSECDGVLWCVAAGDGTNTGTLACKIQESDTDVDGNYVDIAGAAITTMTFDADDNKAQMIDVKVGGRAGGLRKKYQRSYLVTAVQTSPNCVLALKYGVHSQPAVNSPVAVLVPAT